MLVVGVVAAVVLAAVMLVVQAPESPPPSAPPVGAIAVATAVPENAPAASAAPVVRLSPTFVGAAACAGCHAAETDAWRGSQHSRAMQPATDATVLGDFHDVSFTHKGVATTFTRKDGRYVVRTDGPDGKRADFPIAYTFGVYPLQQYLVPFPDGRLQAFTVAWDARPRAAGGQRWFHLFPNEPSDSHDALHWTRLRQNWNFGCADCHSTNLHRNYDAKADRYATTWTDLSVACEACHGPGSEHVAWAEHRAGSERLPDHGLAIALDERRDVAWLPNAAGNASRSRPLDSHREVETCAVCHARRAPLVNNPLRASRASSRSSWAWSLPMKPSVRRQL